MKHSLTVCVITARTEASIGWILDGIESQLREGDQVKRVVVVSSAHGLGSAGVVRGMDEASVIETVFTPPKPTIWQGAHRKTSEDWWAASNARNTGLCLADTEWIWWLDDRLVLADGALAALREAMDQGYAVFGAYEKRHGMKVADGKIVEPGVLKGEDDRLKYMQAAGWPLDQPVEFGPRWAAGWGYGCCVALPVKWALQVGGFEQAMDGQGFEDVIFGLMLGNCGFPLRYDPRLKVIEDRTPSQCGRVMRKEDKGVSPDDKSHRALELYGKAFQTTNRAQVLQSRAAVLRGEPFPVLLDSETDWWDGERIDEHYMGGPKA